jgi:hypothetical protein
MKRTLKKYAYKISTPARIEGEPSTSSRQGEIWGKGKKRLNPEGVECELRGK